MKKIGRRCIIKGIGSIGVASSLGSNVIGEVSADNRNNSAKSAGVSRRIDELLKKGEFKKASNILNKNNVVHSYVRKKVQREPDSVSGASVGTQSFFGKSESSFYGGVYKWTDEEFKAVVAVNLNLGNSWADGPAPRDVGVIAWEGDVFGPIKVDEIRTELQYVNSETKDMDPKFVNKPNDPLKGSYENAYILSFKDNKNKNSWSGRMYPTGGYVYFDCILRKQKAGTKGNIVCKYGHTWSILNIAQYNILESVSISGGPVGVSIDVPTGADRWALGESFSR
ncbi:MAG: hypothetical protein ABEI57_03670 [Halapricum sp.]